MDNHAKFQPLNNILADLIGTPQWAMEHKYVQIHYGF